MYQSRVKYILLVLVIIAAGTRLSAQTTASSTTDNTSNPLTGRLNNPYSKYGIGELANGNSVVLKGMGNITSAFENPYEINTDNPASYAFLQRTTFEFGAMGETRSIASGSGISYRTGTASISYLSLGLPVGKNGGMCLGFRPISNSYYNLADTLSNSPIGQIANSYSGQGSLNYAFLGGAIKRKGLSIGFNAGYMFGTLQNITAVLPFDTTPVNRAYTSEFANYTHVGGVYWKVGALYKVKLDSSYTLHIGATASMKQQLLERYSSYQISSFNLGDTLVHDTASKFENQRGNMTMPLSYSIGAILSKNDRWSLGIDYTSTQWSGFASTPDNARTLGVGSSSYRVSLGGDLTPDANSIRNYFSKITYRAGIYYGSDYLNISGTALPVYGVTLGGSLPFRRSLSKLHLGLDVGRLGTESNNLTQQTYVKFSLGISFNDKWFIPRKYD